MLGARRERGAREQLHDGRCHPGQPGGTGDERGVDVVGFIEDTEDVRPVNEFSEKEFLFLACPSISSQMRAHA